MCASQNDESFIVVCGGDECSVNRAKLSQLTAGHRLYLHEQYEKCSTYIPQDPCGCQKNTVCHLHPFTINKNKPKFVAAFFKHTCGSYVRMDNHSLRTDLCDIFVVFPWPHEWDESKKSTPQTWRLDSIVKTHLIFHGCIFSIYVYVQI